MRAWDRTVAKEGRSLRTLVTQGKFPACGKGKAMKPREPAVEYFAIPSGPPLKTSPTIAWSPTTGGGPSSRRLTPFYGCGQPWTGVGMARTTILSS
jgi:hypothetical protein